MATAPLERALDAYLARNHGVITLDEALTLGLTPAGVQYRLRTGRWRAVHRGVYAPAEAPLSAQGATLAACVAAGTSTRASHRSAGWLWGMLPYAPARPALTVPSALRRSLAGVDLHRSKYVPSSRQRRQEIPVTAPIRTVIDLASVLPEAELHRAVDVGLAHRVFRAMELQDAVEQWASRGRTGVPQLRRALDARGFVHPPAPSVLESMTMRLLRSWDIKPLATQVEVLDGRARVDFQLSAIVVLEVDGYSFHWSPEAKAADSRRRNALRAAGYSVVESDWVTVTRYPQLLRADIDAALRACPPRVVAKLPA